MSSFFGKGNVTYFREHKEIISRGNEGSCSPTLDVLLGLMNEININEELAMIAYGDLIHMHREKNFLNKTKGNYIDDNIEMWISIKAAKLIAELEKELFSLFG